VKNEPNGLDWSAKMEKEDAEKKDIRASRNRTLALENICVKKTTANLT
jgi:hypothetical protein